MSRELLGRTLISTHFEIEHVKPEIRDFKSTNLKEARIFHNKYKDTINNTLAYGKGNEEDEIDDDEIDEIDDDDDDDDDDDYDYDDDDDYDGKSLDRLSFDLP